MYSQIRITGKPNNVSCLGAIQSKGLNQDNQERSYHIPLSANLHQCNTIKGAQIVSYIIDDVI